MAGGGIVAFAEGGDTEEYAGGGVVAFADRGQVKDAGVTDIVDPGWRSAKTFNRNYTNDDKFAVLAEQLAELTTAERQAQGLDKIRIQKDMEELRSTMRNLKASPQAQKLLDIIPLGSAQAGEVNPAAPKPAAPKPSMPAKSAENAVYSPEGVLLYGEPPTEPAVRKVEPGKPYQPNLLRDILEGKPRVPLPKLNGPTPSPAPAAETAPPAPKITEMQAERPTEKFEAKQEVGPARPAVVNRLRRVGIEEPQALTMDKAIEEQDKAYEKTGVSKDLFSQIRQDYESKRGKFKDRADKAAGHALMMFGAGLMGARRGSEFETVSRSAQQSLMMYMNTMDKLSEQDDKLDQSLRELTIAEDQYKRTRADSALSRVQKQQDKIDAIKLENAKLELTAQTEAAKFALGELQVSNPSQWVTINNIAKSSGKSPVDVFMMTQGVAKSGEISRTTAFKEYNDLIANPMSKNEMNKQYPGGFEDYFRALQGGGAPIGGKAKFLGYEGQ